MKWFKHLSKSRNDALIRDAITLFGLAGEHVYWRTIEVMADEFDVKKPGFNRFLMKSWSKNYETSVKKTLKVLQFYKEKKVIFFIIKGVNKNQEILLNCPKLRWLADEWTKKMIKKLRSNSRVKPEPAPESLPPIEEEVRRKKKDIKEKQGCLFVLPSKEEVDESALPKIREDTAAICEKLYRDKIFLESYQFKNKMLAEGKNERAILHTLMRCYMKKKFEKGAWGYCLNIMKIESGNFSEREYGKS